MLYGMLAAGIIISVLVLIMSQALIVPLRHILSVVKKTADGYLNERISLKGHDEYSQLAQAFDDMTEKLEQVDKTREEFVSNVSHELKTPLSSMKVLAESLLELEKEPGSLTYREFLQDITSEVDRMTFIINDLLTLVRIDQREQKIIMQPADLNQMVRDIIKRLKPLADQNMIDLQLDEIKPVSVEADEMRVSLALTNIIENGIKYTPEGGMVKVILDSEGQNAVVTVQDTGIGIKDEEQGKIFDRFYRVDKTRDRMTGGTGLGLSISHSAVLAHNGSIRLTSKPGEGSVFVVRLPVSQR
jgi:signal transduction histidine kinase